VSEKRRLGKKNIAIIIIAVVVIAIGSVLAWYFMMRPAAPGVTPRVIKIGYSAPFTGPAAEFGTNGWRGISIALEEINARGVFIKGEKYTVEVIRYDDRCEPTEGVAAVRKLILEDKVIAILGSHCSSVCLAIAPLCNQYKIPGLTIECAADAVTSPGFEYYFRMRPPLGIIAPLITPAIIDKLKPSKIGFLAINDDYGRSFVESFKKNFERYKVPTVVEQYFERGATDFYAYLTAIKAAKPDIVFYVGVTPEGALILKQARELGLIPEIKFIGSEEMGEYELVSLAGKEVVAGTYAITLWAPTPEIRELASKVKEKFNAPMHYAIVFGYDALHVLVKAIERAQSLDPVAIHDALKELEHKGLEGNIKFETFEYEGRLFINQGRYAPYLIRWTEIGEKELIGP
jgi:branched-chain amino acid transport system substrate-binding protein